GGIPNIAVVIAAFPVDTVLSGDQFIHLAYTSAFNAPQLVDRTARWCLLPEASSVHFAHNVETSLVIKRDTGLIEQLVCAGATGLARGVEANPGLTNPDQQAANTRG